MRPERTAEPRGGTLTRIGPVAEATAATAEGAEPGERAGPADARADETMRTVAATATGGSARPRAGGVERQFLPAALEILDTPASPAGRLISLTIMAAFVVALLWAYFGTIDIVATASGRVTPVGGTKLVQAKAISTVRAIHVSDGQLVAAGDILVELDATESEVDIGQLTRQRDEAAVEAARLEALIRAVEGGSARFDPPAGDLDPALVAMHRSRLASDLASFRAKMGSLKAERSQRLATIATTRAEVAKLTELKPLVTEREATMHKLMEQGHTPRPVWQQVKAQLIDVTHDLTIKTYLIGEAESELEAVDRRVDGLVADTLQAGYSGLAEARATFAGADLALRKAMNREELQTLRAPVAGRVHQLAVNTVGGVVRPADPLMVIVPEDAELEVRAQLLNRDKGAVDVGQEVEVKFEAFDFTRYGTVRGKVESISNDALDAGGAGLVYDTRVSLARTSFDVNGATVPFTPGMMVTVDIRLGERRVIEYLLSPLQRYQDEAIRER